MIRYRFETSTTEHEMDGDASTMTTEVFIQQLTAHIFKDKVPPFKLEVVGPLDEKVIVIRRCYSNRFQRTKPTEKPPVAPKKRKRRWRSPEPLVNIMRRRGIHLK